MLGGYVKTYSGVHPYFSFLALRFSVFPNAESFYFNEERVELSRQHTDALATDRLPIHFLRSWL
jgi:hypothetical protein